MNNLVMIVEDEKDIADILEKYVQHAGFDTYVHDNGIGVLEEIEQRKPALLLLDRMLPGRDGIAICKQIRETSELPVIMVTAMQEEQDILLGLEVGADDYICKPFSAREVVARIKSVLRRFGTPEPDEQHEIRVDEGNYQVFINGKDIGLTLVEYRLFHLMYSSPNQVFNRQHIMDSIYDDYRVVSDRSIDTHVKNLRKKIDSSGIVGKNIKAVYGLGYKFAT